jgi:glycosyltransferase involved in cell wall biosynthesis
MPTKRRSALVSLIAESPTKSLPEQMMDADSPSAALTHAMVLSWFSRPVLQEVFDLDSREGRQGLRRWYLRQSTGTGARKLWRQTLALLNLTALRRGHQFEPGVNLVGYAQGVLGMGEHVRMSALAMRAAGVPSVIVDFTLGLGRRRQRAELRSPIARTPKYQCNLFHVNADQMPRTYLHLGNDFFADRYNIGYWAWELPRWPSEWIPAIGTVDEIWAPSQFVRDAITPVTGKPVLWMPLCVELPPVPPIPRSQFGLEADAYYFLFTFDGHSFFERKNPEAVVRSFKAAFPRERDARLIVKAMNAEVSYGRWNSLRAEVASDDRILLIDETWTRDRVLALVASCDVYVSLHRSEGFGRGPAEAMLLGKPAIVTDYSGTTDFCRKDNALLVDYELVEVEHGSYVGADGQVWADPSIECAARHMRALFEDRTLGRRIGERARRTISEEFSAVAIGRRYRARLEQLGILD